MKKRLVNIYAKYGSYFPADLWAFLLMFLMLIGGIVYVVVAG